MKQNIKDSINELYEKYGEIEIICDGSSYLPIDSLVKFQGNLKKLPEKNLLKLAKIIFYHGFAAPFFTFDNKGDWCILDGSQRREVILAIRESGVPIPGQFPVIEIKADTEQKAREILLSITSQFGIFQKDILDDWALDIEPEIVETLRLVDTEIDLAITELSENIEQESEILNESIKDVKAGSPDDIVKLTVTGLTRSDAQDLVIDYISKGYEVSVK